MALNSLYLPHYYAKTGLCEWVAGVRLSPLPARHPVFGYGFGLGLRLPASGPALCLSTLSCLPCLSALSALSALPALLVLPCPACHA